MPITPDLFGPTAQPALGEIEDACADIGERLLIGVDEVGRGPLAGPVVTAAVTLDPDAIPEGLDDSKRLTEARREALFDVIKDAALAWSIAEIDHAEIDRVNILQATFLGMIRCIDAVTERLDARGLTPDMIIVDGKQRVPIARPQRCVVKGDRRSLNVAAASILAKVYRDRLMVDFDATYPGYGFAQHKGYPTRTHKAAVARLGPCPIHRRTFKGVREHLPTDDDSA